MDAIEEIQVSKSEGEHHTLLEKIQEDLEIFNQEILKELGLGAEFDKNKPAPRDPEIYRDIVGLFDEPEPEMFYRGNVPQTRLERLARAEARRLSEEEAESSFVVNRSDVGPIRDLGKATRRQEEIEKLETAKILSEDFDLSEALKSIERLAKAVEDKVKKHPPKPRPRDALDNYKDSLENSQQAQKDWDEAADRWELASRIAMAAQEKGLVSDEYQIFHQYLNKLLTMTDEELARVQDEVGVLPDISEVETDEEGWVTPIEADVSQETKDWITRFEEEIARRTRTVSLAEHQGPLKSFIVDTAVAATASLIAGAIASETSINQETSQTVTA